MEVEAMEWLREREKEKFYHARKGAVPVMDTETLRQICLENDGYETPELNDSMYAHFRGFQKIQGLDAYSGLKALWLESNGLSKIENLDCLPHLRCLYLSKNLITKIENVDQLQHLNTLDLSENRLETLDGIRSLPHITTLNVSHNLLESSSSIQELASCSLISNVDLSHNHIEEEKDSNQVLDVLKSMPALRALRITGNPVVSSTRYFRKTYLSQLPELAFMDRPVFPLERCAVTAWLQGGNEAELKAKQDFVQRENDDRRRSLQEFRDWQASVREKRLKEIEAEKKEKADKKVDNQEAEDVDLKGFRGISKEEYLALGEVERKVWDTRIQEAYEDTKQAEKEVYDIKSSAQSVKETEQTPRVDTDAVTSEDHERQVHPPPAPVVISKQEMDESEITRIEEEDVAENRDTNEDSQEWDAMASFRSSLQGTPAPERETWEQMQRRASFGLLRHQPEYLPSTEDDTDDDEASDEDEETVRPLTRDEIIRDLRRLPTTEPSSSASEEEQAVTNVNGLD